VDPAPVQEVRIPASESTRLHYRLQADDPGAIHNSNRATLQVQPHGRPAEAEVPIVLVGARRWLLWGPQVDGTASPDTLLDQPQPPEEHLGKPASSLKAEARGDGWHIACAGGNEMPVSIGTDWTGVLYARLFLRSPHGQDVRIGVPATCPRKLWLN